MERRVPMRIVWQVGSRITGSDVGNECHSTNIIKGNECGHDYKRACILVTPKLLHSLGRLQLHMRENPTRHVLHNKENLLIVQKVPAKSGASSTVVNLPAQ